MAALDLNRETAGHFIARLEAVQGVEQRQWGQMGPEKMVRHLRFMFELSLGERTAQKMFMPVPSVVTWLIFFNWYTTWPGAAFKAPAGFFPEPEGALEAEKAACRSALERFVAQLEIAPEQKGFSPLLGNIPLRKWARVHGVHMAHHLRQYGV